jgi:hypothetical protein
MKKHNLPKFFFNLFFLIIGISIFVSAISGGGGGFGIFLIDSLIAPIVIILMIIWKLYNRGVKNKYFVLTIVINILIIILMLYIFAHMFDGMLM